MNLPPLPAPYSWGEWSGDYRKIMRDGQKIAAFGGVVSKVVPERQWPAEIAYCIAKGERERAKGDNV